MNTINNYREIVRMYSQLINIPDITPVELAISKVCWRREDPAEKFYEMGYPVALIDSLTGKDIKMLRDKVSDTSRYSKAFQNAVRAHMVLNGKIAASRNIPTWYSYKISGGKKYLICDYIPSSEEILRVMPDLNSVDAWFDYGIPQKEYIKVKTALSKEIPESHYIV